MDHQQIVLIFGLQLCTQWYNECKIQQLEWVFFCSGILLLKRDYIFIIYEIDPLFK